MDIRYVLACCTDMALGDSRKYIWPYMYTVGFSEFWGQGGFFELEIQEHWGVLMTGIPNAWGGFRSGISTGERESVFPENAYFIDLISLQTKHELTTLLQWPWKTLASIDQWCFHMVFICRGKPTKSGFYIKLHKNMLQNILFSLMKTVS